MWSGLARAGPHTQAVSMIGLVKGGGACDLMEFPYSFAPAGLASSLALIPAELYLMIRFIFFTSPKGLRWFSKLGTLGDSRVYRTFNLLLLDVLTITSAVKPTNLLVDFIPFAIYAVVVLCKLTLRTYTISNHLVVSRVQLGVGKNWGSGHSLDVVIL